MTKFKLVFSGSCALFLGLAMQVPAAGAGTNDSVGLSSGEVVGGTIPAARPGLPPRGLLGAIRAESRLATSTDPAIRDTNPLTANGLWETGPGNAISQPGMSGRTGGASYQPK